MKGSKFISSMDQCGYQKMIFLAFISGGNLYKETIEFLKDEIEEIEQVRNMLKAEDDRLGGKSGKSQYADIILMMILYL